MDGHLTGLAVSIYVVIELSDINLQITAYLAISNFLSGMLSTLALEMLIFFLSALGSWFTYHRDKSLTNSSFSLWEILASLGY